MKISKIDITSKYLTQKNKHSNILQINSSYIYKILNIFTKMYKEKYLHWNGQIEDNLYLTL